MAVFRPILLTAVALGLSCATPLAPPDGSRDDWVGRQVCAGCHAEQHDAWRGSHHDLAMQEATERTVLGDFDDATLTYNGVTSTFTRKDGRFLVATEGPDGQLASYTAAYTFGVEPLQQYLIEFPDGRLQALGIAWDARPAKEGGQRWYHLYPDEPVGHEDPLHWTGPYQNWNHMCAECHSTGLRKNFDADLGRFETSWFEIDVSCEACHGPGSRHVAWARNEARDPGTGDAEAGLTVRLQDTDGGAWLMDQATGIAKRVPPRESETELQVCARCHSRRSLLHEQDSPGQPLLDTHRLALLDEGLYHADGQILDEVYVYASFLQSKMHTAGVRCGDCHDPHSLGLHGSIDTVCARCHLPARFDTTEHHLHPPDSEGARCVACHMPERTYMGVDPRGDHSFRIPRPDLSLRLGTPNACQTCHAERGDRWAADALAGHHGPREEPHYGETLSAARRGDAAGVDGLPGLIGDPGQPAIVRATALSLLGPAAAETTVGSALVDDEPIVRLAALAAAEFLQPTVRARLALPLLDDPVRAVRIEAASVLAPLHTLPQVAARRAELDAGIAEYRASQQLNADRAESQLNLALLHAQLGDTSSAEAAYRKAIEVDASFVPAYVNLADLARMQGRDEEALALLQEVLEKAPGSAEAQHALGLALVRLKRSGEALEPFGRAYALRPEEPRYGYVYGVALHSTGKSAQALEVLAASHARHGTDRDILIGLIAIARDAGRLDLSLQYAERLVQLDPTDAQAAGLLQQLRSTQR